MELIKIEYWNTTDTAGIKFTGQPFDFHPVLYVHSDVWAPDYTIEQGEVKDNQNGEPIPGSQKWAKYYKLEIVGYEYLADALSLLPFMDNVYITLKNQESQKVKDISVAVDWNVDTEQPCIGTIILSFAFDIHLKTACNENFNSIQIHENMIAALEHVATIYDTDKLAPPETFINEDVCKVGDDGTNTLDTYLHFTGIPLKNDSVILASYLVFRAKTTKAGDDCDAWVQVENDTGSLTFNAAVIPDLAGYNAGSWDTRVAMNAVDHLTAEDFFQTVDISAVLTTLINTDSWIYGNNINLRVTFKATCDNAAYREFYAYDGATISQRPKLVIQYI